MQVTVNKKEFLRLLARCQGVADKKSTMPVLGNVLLETEDSGLLRLSATDLFLSVSGTIPAEIEQPGTIAIGAKDLLDRVKMMQDGKLSISTTDGANTTLRALGQPRRYTLHGVAGEDFPSLPEPEKDIKPLTLDVGTLAHLISSTYFSVSTDETRYHLNSALFELEGSTVRMVTTDGHRLSKLETQLEVAQADTSMLIPLKGILELRRLCDEAKSEGQKTLTLCQNGTNAFFDVVGVQFGVKLVDARFPAYNQVIPESTAHTIRVPRAEVADALRAVSVAASDRTGGVKVSLSNNVIRFASENPDSGDGFDEVVVDYNGENLTVGFNAKYFLDVLGAIDTEDLTLGISGELDPAVIQPAPSNEGSDYLAVIMPMRI